MFPAEAVPDGAIAAPHHYLWAVYAALAVIAVVWDDHPHEEPLVTAGGLAASWFGWVHVWTWYPVLGALLAISGVLLAFGTVTAPGGPWTRYPAWARWTIVAALLVALDDLASHALGLWTPLDWLWGELVVYLPS